MATRSFIWMKAPEGWKGIYCHWGGYLEGVGEILRNHYTNSDKIEKLINLGDISMLAPEICEKNDFDNPDKNCVLAYHRDRGDDWADCAPKTARNVDEAIDISREYWAEYIYFWDGAQWHCYDWGKDKWVYGLGSPVEHREASIEIAQKLIDLAEKLVRYSAIDNKEDVVEIVWKSVREVFDNIDLMKAIRDYVGYENCFLSHFSVKDYPITEGGEFYNIDISANIHSYRGFEDVDIKALETFLNEEYTEAFTKKISEVFHSYSFLISCNLVDENNLEVTFRFTLKEEV